MLTLDCPAGGDSTLSNKYYWFEPEYFSVKAVKMQLEKSKLNEKDKLF